MPRDATDPVARYVSLGAEASGALAQRATARSAAAADPNQQIIVSTIHPTPRPTTTSEASEQPEVTAGVRPFTERHSHGQLPAGFGIGLTTVSGPRPCDRQAVLRMRRCA
jgi:hypothetical protein